MARKARLGFLIFVLLSGLQSIGHALPQMFHVENRSSHDFSGWVGATIPFLPGEVPNEAALAGITADGNPADLYPIKWHFTNGKPSSIALTRLRALTSLKAYEKRDLSLSRGTPQQTLPDFRFGPELLALGSTGRMLQHFAVGVKPKGGNFCWSGMLGNDKVLLQEKSLLVVRTRNHPRCGNGPLSNASLTYYWSFNAGEDHGEVTIVVGNDTAEAAVGQLDLDAVELYVKAPMRVEIHEPQAFGIPPADMVGAYQRWKLLQGNYQGAQTHLADGQTVAFKARWAVIGDSASAKYQSFLAAGKNPSGGINGFVDFNSARASGAFGPLGFIPNSRFTNLQQARSSLDHHCTDSLVAGPMEHLGEINLVPSITGDQPDFMANIARFHLKALHTQSPCPLRRAYIAVLREALRPSYFWLVDETGTEDRLEIQDSPDYFFWSGYPHFDPSWNTGKTGLATPYLQIRNKYFNPGDRNGWAPYDNQHLGHNSVLSAYEATGDSFLGDLIRYNLAISYLDFYTGYAPPRLGWFWTTEAERAVGRVGKAATYALRYFPNEPNAVALQARLLLKDQSAIGPAIASSLTTYGVAALDPAKDSRINLYNQCVAGAFEPRVSRNQCDCVMAWQTGFHMEQLSQSLLSGIDSQTAGWIADRYLDDVPKYFDLASGRPVTYFLLRDPTAREFGGIGQHWWAGWISLATLRSSHPNSAFILNKALPPIQNAIEGSVTEDLYWKSEDDWKNHD